MSDTGEPIIVPPVLAGERLDRVVALLTGWSRAEVQALIKAEGVLVDGEPAAKSVRLTEGQVVDVVGAPPVVELPGPEPVPLDVRYADDDVVVLAKEAGVVVHPGAGHQRGTLVHGLLHKFPEIASVGDPARPGIVHRLDRDTSGLMVVARSALAYDELVRALAARGVDRHYLALVWGIPDTNRGMVDAPIGRSTRRRTRMAVREGGRDARTGFEVRQVFDRVSLLECRLETGRTHQIRVHLSAIGHPIVGDAAYGGRRSGIALERPFLHAHRLSIRHPRTGEQLDFEDPVPPELARVLDDLASV